MKPISQQQQQKRKEQRGKEQVVLSTPFQQQKQGQNKGKGGQFFPVDLPSSPNSLYGGGIYSPSQGGGGGGGGGGVSPLSKMMINFQDELEQQKQQQQQCGGGVAEGSGCKTSKYKGVSWSKDKRKWEARGNKDGDRKYIGRYESQEEAAHKYDEWARDNLGVYAILNFNPETGEFNPEAKMVRVGTTKRKRQSK